MKKILIISLILIIYYSPSSAQNKDLPEWTRSDDIIKVHYDTTYYRSGTIKSIQTLHEKKFDDTYNLLVAVGSRKTYYRNNQIKFIDEFDNYGAFLSRNRYYRNGNLKGQSLSDTTSKQTIIRGFRNTQKFEYEIIYLKSYRRDGTMRREGRWKNYLRYGEWIFYDREGNIRKTKEY